MQSCRFSSQAPLRIVKRVPATSRNMAFYAPFSRVPRHAQPFFPSFQQDFAPFFRMFDELENVSRNSLRTYQPRFDVREDQDAFHLQGELPGIKSEDVDIEFTDSKTLVVRGRTIKEHRSDNQAASVESAAPKAVENNSEFQADVEGTQTPQSETTSNYQRPSIEEERDEYEVLTSGAPTPASTATELAQPAELEKTEQQANKPATDNAPHYWVSERSVGEFHRTFNFPSLVDQDNVTAQLRNGVLSIVVPKQQPKQPKKIIVQ